MMSGFLVVASRAAAPAAELVPVTLLMSLMLFSFAFGRPRDETQPGEFVHVAGGLPLFFQLKLPPHPVAEPFERAPPPIGLAHRDRRERERLHGRLPFEAAGVDV